MPTAQYTALANITLGSTAASVTFSSISQSYRDLLLVASGATSSADYLKITINGSTADGQVMVLFGSSGSLVNYWTGNNGRLTNQTVFTNFNLTLNMMDYVSTNKQKSMLYRLNAPFDGTAGTQIGHFRWAQAATAITSFVLFPAGTTWAAGTTFALYGVK